MDDRLTELEVKSAYQEQRLRTLDDVLLEQSKRIDELEKSVVTLERALRRVRNELANEPVSGALPEEDPVPNSG